MEPTITEETVAQAARQVTPYPIIKWYTRPDGALAVINAIGQKFLIAIETIPLNPPPKGPSAAARRPKPQSRKAPPATADPQTEIRSAP